MVKSEKRELSIFAKLTDQVSPNAAKMLRGIKKFSTGSVKLFGGVLKRVFNLKTALVGLATSVIGLGTLQAFGDQADNLLKLSNATGDTVANLSELQSAFELNNVPADAFGEILKSLLNQSREAQRGNLDLRQSFENLGVSMEDLERLAPAQLFERVAAGLDQFNTKQEEAAALGKLLPENFLRLLPVLGNGLRAFQDSIVEAREAGATVTEQQAETAAALNTALGKLKISIGGVSRALIEEFGPDAIAILNKVATTITENREGITEFVSLIGSGIARAADLAVSAIINLVAAIESIPGVNLLGEDTEQQIIELERRLSALRGAGPLGGDGPAAAQIQLLNGAEISRIEGQIRTLREKASGGLTEELRSFRSELTQELSRAAAEIRSTTAGNAVVGDDAANAIGFPTLAEVEKIKQGITEAMRSDPSSGQFQSIFQTPDKEPLQAFKRATDEASNSVRELRRLVEERPVIAFDGNFFDGFSDGAKRSVAEFTNLSSAGQQAANDLIGGGLNGITNALGDIISRTQTSRQAWTALGQSTIAVLGRVLARLIAVKAASALFGSSVQLETGGIVQGTMGQPVRAQAFAQGGIATGPTLALFGEGRNAEAFVPLPDGRTIPVTMTGGGAGGYSFTFNISAVDGESVRRMLVNERDTIAGIMRNQLETKVSMRQVVQRATA